MFHFLNLKKAVLYATAHGIYTLYLNGYGDCLDTGFLSVHLLLDVLADTGHADTAYKLLFQTKCPGWLYMVEHGATTIWETWDCVKEDGSVGTYSYNHYAYGCVGKWLYTRLAGITAKAPGYKEVQICPGIDSGLTHVKAAVETPRGTLKVAWEIKSGQLHVETVIPKGVTARLILPGQEIKLETGVSCHHGLCRANHKFTL